MNSRRTYLATHFFTYFFIQTAIRFVMIACVFEALSHEIWEILGAIGIGMLFDATLGAIYVLPMGIFLTAASSKFLSGKSGRRCVFALAFLMNFFLFFTTIALFFFRREFNADFNFVAADFFACADELFGDIWQVLPAEFLLPLLAAAAFVAAGRQMRKLPERFVIYGGVEKFIRCLILLLPVGLAFLLPDDLPQKASDNRYNAEIAANSHRAFACALAGKEIDYRAFYFSEDEKSVRENLRQKLSANNTKFTSTEGIERDVVNKNRLSDKKPHIIIIMADGLSSPYSSVFGNAKRSSAPNMDELAQNSFVFTKMFATGAQRAQGLEAVSLSMPPAPGRSIMRRADNADMLTIGELMREQGYKTDFIYGGYGYFGNINEFFESRGFEVKDRLAMSDGKIFGETKWGMADETLYAQVIKRMDEHFDEGESAFQIVLTAADRRADDFEKSCRNADRAVGDFLRRAKEKPWFNNTVFVIMGNHHARGAQRTSLPVNEYKIPCLVYAPQLIPPGKSERLMSQADISPTLFGMLGISYKASFMGRDIFAAAPEGDRAFIGDCRLLGYVKGGRLMILSPDGKAECFKIEDWEKSIYSPVKADEELTKEAVAHYQGASLLYRRGLLNNAPVAAKKKKFEK